MAGTIRIPKMYSILSTDYHLREKNAMWDTLQDQKSRNINEVIHQHLDEETKGKIDAKDIWVSVSLYNFLHLSKFH